MYRFRQSLNRFARDESGVLLAEFLLLLPLLIWGFLALVVYWDVFRTINTSQKAAYSIADLMSRQEIVTPQFVDQLQNVLDFLMPGVVGSRMRITSFEYNATTKKYVFLFSRSPGNKVIPYTATTLQNIAPRVPVMDDLDSALLVETWVDYVPKFDIGVLGLIPGLSGQTLEQFIITYPRRRRVCLLGTATCV
jgi:hypothetical protein